MLWSKISQKANQRKSNNKPKNSLTLSPLKYQQQKLSKLFLCIKWVSNLQEQPQRFSFLGHYKQSLIPISSCYFCNPGREILGSTELRTENRSWVSLIFPFTKMTEFLTSLFFCYCCLFSKYTIHYFIWVSCIYTVTSRFCNQNFNLFF